MGKNNIGRLEEILNQIEDERMRNIVRGVFKVEISYRSTERVNFPWQRVRDVIEGVARTSQLRLEEKPYSDEATEN